MYVMNPLMEAAELAVNKAEANHAAERTSQQWVVWRVLGEFAVRPASADRPLGAELVYETKAEGR